MDVFVLSVDERITGGNLITRDHCGNKRIYLWRRETWRTGRKATSRHSVGSVTERRVTEKPRRDHGDETTYQEDNHPRGPTGLPGGTPSEFH